MPKHRRSAQQPVPPSLHADAPVAPLLLPQELRCVGGHAEVQRRVRTVRARQGALLVPATAGRHGQRLQHRLANEQAM